MKADGQWGCLHECTCCKRDSRRNSRLRHSSRHGKKEGMAYGISDYFNPEFNLEIYLYLSQIKRKNNFYGFYLIDQSLKIT